LHKTAFEQLGSFRQKVIRLCVFEKKSIYQAAVACGCTPEKIKRVLKKWKMMQKQQKKNALAAHE
jgi:hypothetical protein